MKKILSAMVFQAALLFLVFAQQTHLDIKIPDSLEDDLFGAVRSISIDTCYNMSDEHMKEQRVYDTFGNLLSETNWTHEGEVSDTTTYNYDENGCFTTQLYVDHAKGKTYNWVVILSPSTRQIAKRNKRTGTTVLRTYSPEKYLVRYKQMDKEKKLVRASHTKRRADNREAEYIRFDKKNRPLYTSYFKWNDRGFVDKEKVRYHQEEKESLYTYDYLKVDEHGNWTQRLKTGYDIRKKEKQKTYEKLTVRTIEYFDEDPLENEP